MRRGGRGGMRRGGEVRRGLTNVRALAVTLNGAAWELRVRSYRQARGEGGRRGRGLILRARWLPSFIGQLRS